MLSGIARFASRNFYAVVIVIATILITSFALGLFGGNMTLTYGVLAVVALIISSFFVNLFIAVWQNSH